MIYVALLRGVNAGNLRRIDMKRLKEVFVDLGYNNVSTYINSGNIIFSSNKKSVAIRNEIEKCLKVEFGFDIPALVKSLQEMKMISDSIPSSWKDDESHKSDVAYLFPDIDSKTILEKLPIRKEFIDIRYVPGALFWNVARKDYNKSHINKIINHDSYKYMTLRNVNTARVLSRSE